MIDYKASKSVLGPIGRMLFRHEGHRGPILVVEDEPALQHAVAVALRTKGYEVARASNGADAIRVIEGQDPSLVILDMHMPVLYGWGFAAALRKQGYSVPILVTTTGSAEAATAANEIGARGCLPKPFTLGELLEAVSELLPAGREPPGFFGRPYP
jgi:DNA-binding response OmpR family regulator